MGQRASETRGITFQDVRVPKEVGKFLQFFMRLHKINLKFIFSKRMSLQRKESDSS